MKAIILAAGYATRLYPLTKDKPKPLLSVAGKPIIEHILMRIEEVDEIDEIFVITNDKFYTQFMEWKDQYESSKTIKIINDGTSTNEDRLGAIGDIDLVVRQENINEPLLVVAGDNIFDFSLGHMVSLFDEKGASVVGLYDVKDEALVANKLGVAKVDDNLKIVGFEEKPEKPSSTLAATCCYLFAQKDIQYLEQCIKENKKPDNAGEFIKWLSEKEHVYGYVFSEKWFDIGSHEQLKEAEKHWSK